MFNVDIEIDLEASKLRLPSKCRLAINKNVLTCFFAKQYRYVLVL